MNGFGDVHIKVNGKRAYTFEDIHQLSEFLKKGMSCLSLELSEQKIKNNLEIKVRGK